MRPINLVVIEDAISIRENLVASLSEDKQMVTIFEYGTVESFLTRDESLPIPNVVLLDLQLPRMKGDEAIDAILLKYPSTNILIYTMYMDTSTILKCVTKGAVGYLLKTQHSLDEIKEAIKTVNRGGSFLSPTIARKVLNHFHPSSATRDSLNLTMREEQVMNGLMHANTYQQIADDLNISIDTVRTYIKKIYSKMQVKNKAELVSKVQQRLYVNQSLSFN